MSSGSPTPAEPGGPAPAPDLRRWELAGIVALAVVVLTVPLSLLRPPRTGAAAGPLAAAPIFVGSAACESCHQPAFNAWRGSHHERAMDVASERSVLGDFGGASFTHRGTTSRFYRRDGRFFVHTEGPAGKMDEFEIAYTFGVKPLQQYLVRFPGGRLQCLTIAWDTERRRWFHLYPEQDIPASDWLHWTRNAQNWNGMCAECHSTNLEKGYDPEADTYETTWSDINVGCEACHGPGSRHVAWARIPAMARPETPDRGLAVPTSGITSAQLVELCAPCHSRRAELGDYDHGGRLLMDHMLPSLLSEGLYYPDGQQQDEVYTYASFLQSKMYARGVRCSDCHDSHSLKLKRDGNEVCLQCHVREVFDGPEHHFHKKTVDGRPSDGALCARCHMPKRTYMVVDPRSDHSFRRPRPDLTAEIGTPNACTQAGCHADKPLSYSLNAYRKWYGQARRPHFGTTFAAAREGRSEAAPELLRLVEDALQPGIVRATALALLERYRGEAATRALRRALLSDEPLLRQVAASSFALPDPRERVAALAPLLLDPVKAVRLAAVGALAGAPRDELKPYQREAFDQGLAEYRAAMAYSLDFASSGLNLGNLHASLGQPGEAEKYYRLALKVDDLFYPAKMNLAVLLSGRGRGAEAEALLREVVARYPENADARYSLGLLLVELGKPEEAAGHLRAAAFAMPRNARARYNLGLLLDQLGRSDEALLWLARALDLDPTSADCLHALAGLELKRDRPQRALAFAERLVAAHPELPVGRELKDAAERALRSRPAR